MERLSYKINVYDVLSQLEIKNKKINMIPSETTFVDATGRPTTVFYYLLSTYGDHEARLNVKRYFWSKMFAMFKPHYDRLTLSDWRDVATFFNHSVWIDNTPIEVSLKGWVVPPQLFRNLAEAWNLSTKGSAVKSIVVPNSSNDSVTIRSRHLIIGAYIVVNVLTLVLFGFMIFHDFRSTQSYESGEGVTFSTRRFIET